MTKLHSIFTIPSPWGRVGERSHFSLPLPGRGLGRGLGVGLLLLLSSSIALALPPLGGGLGRGPSISIFGDSYSTFEGCLVPDTNAIWYYPAESPEHHKGNDVVSADQCWWSIVIKELGARLERNNSFSGSTICRSGYAKDKSGSRVPVEGFTQLCDYTNRSFVNRSNYLGNPDIILVCGGTNDSWCGAPIGEYIYGNWTDLQLYTFRPAFAKMLSDLKQHYPTARLLFMLNSELKESINESVHTICKHYGVDCLDLHDIDKQGGHPSQKGMKAIAEQVLERLR